MKLSFTIVPNKTMKKTITAVMLGVALSSTASAGLINEGAINPITGVAIQKAAPTVAPRPVPDIPAVEVRGVNQSWSLSAGKTLHEQLAAWAERAGWSFAWRPTKSWLVPADATFTGTFDEAIEKVAETLYGQGKPVRLVLWEGNRFAEIIDVNIK